MTVFKNFVTFLKILSATAVKLDFTKKKWGIPAVPLKILKVAWEPVVRPQEQDYPPIFDHSLASGVVKPLVWGVPMIEQSRFISTIKFWKNPTISDVYFGPGNPKKRFLWFFHIFFHEKMGRISGNLEWDDLGISSETTWESRVRRRNGFSVLRISTKSLPAW